MSGRRPTPAEFFQAADNVAGSVDAFGRFITNNPRVQLDIASQYKFSPERLRLFLNGSREFVQYGDHDASKFEDADSSHVLKPGGGDTMHIESAESCTYVVGTEMQATWAVKISQSLSGDDMVRIGPYNGLDGWYIEHRGDHQNDRTADLVVENNGTRTVMKEDVEFPRPFTEYNRYALNFNWYNVGNQEWIQTYTESGEQVNKSVAVTSRDGVKATRTANLNLWYEVTADASTTGLELDCGSLSFSVQSNADQLVRGKPQRKEITIPSGDNIWHPVYAFRLESGTDVNARLNEFEVLRYTNNAAVELLAVSVDPSKTDASGFGVPEYHHAQNTVVQDTESVTTVPDADGVVTDPASTDFRPGGWTISASSLEPSGTNFQAGASQATQTTVKRQVLASDVVVVLARSASAGGTVTFDYVVEQDW